MTNLLRTMTYPLLGKRLSKGALEALAWALLYQTPTPIWVKTWSLKRILISQLFFSRLLRRAKTHGRARPKSPGFNQRIRGSLCSESKYRIM